VRPKPAITSSAMNTFLQCVRLNRTRLRLPPARHGPRGVGATPRDIPLCVRVSQSGAPRQHVVAGTQRDNMIRMAHSWDTMCSLSGSDASAWPAAAPQRGPGNPERWFGSSVSVTPGVAVARLAQTAELMRRSTGPSQCELVRQSRSGATRSARRRRTSPRACPYRPCVPHRN
jgi:hypothetical protein